MTDFRYLSVCSGIEAASVAWDPLGWECAGVAEIEPFPCQVLAQRLGAGRPRYMPDPEATGLSAKDRKQRANAIKAMEGRHMQWGNRIVNFGDFTQIREDDVGPIDLLVGGTPCQAFSIAGARAGLDDPRGNLTLEFLALARRLRPRWVVWENVPGVLSHDKGRTFGTILALMAECGFERWAYRVLDAQYVRVGRFGRAVPQRRRRVFLIGYSGTAPIHPRAVLFDRESLRWNPAPRREAGEGIASSLTASAGGISHKDGIEGRVIPEIVGQAMSAKWSKGSAGPAGDEHHNLIPCPVAHALRGEGFDASEDGTGRGTPIVPVAWDDRNQAASAETYHTLRADQNRLSDGVFCFSVKDYGADAMEDCSPTLRAGGHTTSHANAGVMPAVAFAENSRAELRLEGGDGKIAGALSRGGGKAGQGSPMVAANWRVRRLTPTECHRLQGFPDDWCRIEWRGKPADQCPLGPQYKALGNSKAVNVVTWIGERIAAVDQLP